MKKVCYIITKEGQKIKFEKRIDAVNWIDKNRLQGYNFKDIINY